MLTLGKSQAKRQRQQIVSLGQRSRVEERPMGRGRRQRYEGGKQSVLKIREIQRQRKRGE